MHHQRRPRDLPPSNQNSTSNSSSNNGSITRSNHNLTHTMNAATQGGARRVMERARSARNVIGPNQVMERARSARNLIGNGRPLPILERESSTRNIRELPDQQRPNPHSLRRRSNSTRRVFVASDQGSRSSGGTTSVSTNNSSRLGSQLRRLALERADSDHSIESASMQSWGWNSSQTLTTNNSINNNSGTNNSASLPSTCHDSIMSMLSMDSLTTSTTARNSADLQQQRVPLFFNESITSRYSHATNESDEMMSLFSRDSLTVRQNQMIVDDDPLSIGGGGSGGGNGGGGGGSSSNNNILNIGNRNRTNTIDDDNRSTTSLSECTVYSFDARPQQALSPACKG